MLCWAWCIRFGNRCQIALRIISPCRNPICISRCIQRSSAKTACLLKCRFVLTKCTVSQNMASRRIGAIKRANRLRIRWTINCIGCGRFWIGRTIHAIPKSLSNRLKSICSAMKFLSLRQRERSSICRRARRRLILPIAFTARLATNALVQRSTAAL